MRARRVATQFDFFLGEPLRKSRKKLCRNRLVHEQRFHGVAHGGTLDFGVQRNFPGHFQIGVGIHKNVADALVMFDDRHLEQSATARIRPSPPRGMHRSMYWVSESKMGIASRSATGTTWMAYSGNFASAYLPASIMIRAMA